MPSGTDERAHQEREKERTSGPLAVVHPLPGAMSDAWILDGVIEGRPDAKAALFDRFSKDIYRILARICGVDDDLPDLVQDVFVQALRAMGELQDPNALKAWLRSIAVFTARKHLRKRRRHRWLLFFVFDEVPETVADGPDPVSVEAVRATYAILDTLRPDDRIAFSLRVIDGMDLTEVAAACGVSLATTKRRIAHARSRFEAKARMHPALRELVERGLR